MRKSIKGRLVGVSGETRLDHHMLRSESIHYPCMITRCSKSCSVDHAWAMHYYKIVFSCLLVVHARITHELSSCIESSSVSAHPYKYTTYASEFDEAWVGFGSGPDASWASGLSVVGGGCGLDGSGFPSLFEPKWQINDVLQLRASSARGAIGVEESRTHLSPWQPPRYVARALSIFDRLKPAACWVMNSIGTLLNRSLLLLLLKPIGSTRWTADLPHWPCSFVPGFAFFSSSSSSSSHAHDPCVVYMPLGFCWVYDHAMIMHASDRAYLREKLWRRVIMHWSFGSRIIYRAWSAFCPPWRSENFVCAQSVSFRLCKTDLGVRPSQFRGGFCLQTRR